VPGTGVTAPRRSPWCETLTGLARRFEDNDQFLGVDGFEEASARLNQIDFLALLGSQDGLTMLGDLPPQLGKNRCRNDDLGHGPRLLWRYGTTRGRDRRALEASSALPTSRDACGP